MVLNLEFPILLFDDTNSVKTNKVKNIIYEFNSLTARIFTVFGQFILENRVLHKGACVAALLGTHPGS